MKILWKKDNDNTKKITTTKELAISILEHGNNIDKMSGEDRAKMDARIMAKLKYGKKLTKKEMDYLKKTNPIMYAHALRVQRMAEAIEEQIKHAKSKEEADRILSSSMAGISKNDPDREYIVAAVNRISHEFRESGAYEKLPDTIEEAKKKHSKECGDVFSDAENEEEEDNDGFDLKSWSPLKEVYDSMPTFTAGA